MKRQIVLDGSKIEYTLKNGRSTKSMRLVVCCEGSLTVIAPRWLGSGIIEDFIFKKAGWILRKRKEMMEYRNSLFYQKTEADYKETKHEAKRIVEEKLKRFNSFYGFEYKKVVIRNQSGRWGSCSSKKNLNFNFRIAFLPDNLIDYLIVHELCHLKEMNHSKRFWDLVSKTIPEPRALSRELRRM